VNAAELPWNFYRPGGDELAELGLEPIAERRGALLTHRSVERGG
jgi:hypothetical protein